LFVFALGIVPLSLGQTPVPAASRGIDQVKRFKAEDAERILATPCQLLSTTADFPDWLKAAFVKITKQDGFALANPSGSYQETDVIEEGPKLPSRRLVFAGKCQGYWFIHYEQGGIGHSYAVVFFQDVSNAEPAFVWGGRGFSRATNCNDLREAIDKKLITDDRAFYW
jgi:hypothetical protein